MRKRKYGTSGGVELTESVVEGLAKEAEQGYDIDRLRSRRGRPPMGSEAAAVFQVRLEPAVHEKLIRTASERNVSPSELGRRALRSYLGDHANPNNSDDPVGSTPSGPRHPHLANSTDIEQWSQLIMSRTELARLARNLIFHTGDQVSTLDMRAGVGAEVPGYDGIVEAKVGTPFVPSGRSVWELGTGGDPAKKAQEDYRTRTESPLGENCAEVTFVFLTPRRWDKKADWVRKKKDEGSPWRDIKVFDVDDIEAALERAPGVHFAFSDQLGKHSYGVQGVEDWWNRFRAGGSPILNAEMVLAGRQAQAGSLLKFLNEDRIRTTICAVSADDMLAFVAATISSVPDEGERMDLFGRTVIVRDPRSLQILDRGSKPLILLPYNEDLYREASLVRTNQVVLVGQPGVPAEIDLPPISQEVFAKLLQAVGVLDDRSRVLARAAARSLVAYLGEAGGLGVGQRRSWTVSFESIGVRRAWLAGSWNQGRGGDTDVLSSLAAKSYDDLDQEIRPASRGEDPLFTRVGDVWGVASAEAAWDFARPHITRSDLRELEQAVQVVLGAIDPALDLPVDQRWAAAVYGKARIHSNNLRTGLSTSLSLLGTFGDSVDLGGGATGRTWVERLVGQLLGRANEDDSGQLWTSLADVLPLLAEAAPDEFLGAVNQLSADADSILAKLFLDKKDQDFTVNSPHTGLLWGLELLAWSPDHAGLAVEALARLAEIDPGGRLSNRPNASLTDVFRPWLPQTSAGVDARIEILNRVVDRHPAVAWRLLLSLLPDVHGFATPTYSPRFRLWKPEKLPSVQTSDYWKVVNAVIDGVFRLASADPSRWLEVIQHLPEIPPERRAEALSLLEGAHSAMSSIPGDVKTAIWSALDDLTRRHRSFANAPWALPDEELRNIERVAGMLRPSDPIANNQYLFDDSMPDLGVKKVGGFAENQLLLKEQREKAVREIYEAYGLVGLRRLVEAAKEPFAVGWATAESEIANEDDAVLIELDSEDLRHAGFATGFARARSNSNGWEWISATAKKLTGRPIAQARILLCADAKPMVWALASSLGKDIESTYWREFMPYGLGTEFDVASQTAAELLSHGRARVAIDLLALYVDKQDPRLDPEVVATALETLAAEADSEGQPSAYELQRLLEYLATTDLDEDRLALLEWLVKPGLGFGARSPILERKLARDPGFFVQILAMCFKRHDGADEGATLHKEQVQNAYRLLEEWRIVPGSTEPNGEVDAAALADWIDEVRRRAADIDRSAIADVYIGHILAHSREDGDGTWPTAPVREQLERVGSDKLDQGFRTEIYNKRGVTSRGLTDGGKQEYELASQYDAFASSLSNLWPHTASLLRSVAEGYRAQGRAEDEEAKQFQEGLDR